MLICSSRKTLGAEVMLIKQAAVVGCHIEPAVMLAANAQADCLPEGASKALYVLKLSPCEGWAP